MIGDYKYLHDLKFDRPAYHGAVGTVIKEQGLYVLWCINTGRCSGQAVWVRKACPLKF